MAWTPGKTLTSEGPKDRWCHDSGNSRDSQATPLEGGEEVIFGRRAGVVPCVGS